MSKMNRVSDSPFLKTDLELEISKHLDKIAETGNKFRDQSLELGRTLKSFQEAEGQKIQELQVQSISNSPDWMKPIETKLQEMNKAQHKLSEDIQELEKRRSNLQKLLAGKLDNVLEDVVTLKSLTKTTRELKPKLGEGTRIIRDLETEVEKMTRNLKGKLDLLDSNIKSNQVAIKSSLETHRVITLTEPNDPHCWIVIQRRQSGPRDDFERCWEEYENGFGTVDGNFWLGLKKIHEITADGSKELRVELTDWDGNFAYANYSKFSVENAADLYRLSVSEYSGNAGDSLQFHNGGPFSTKDKKIGGCADKLKGGWWKNKDHANLNGLYYEKKEAKAKATYDYGGIYWLAWKGRDCLLQKVVMKIRKRKKKEENTGKGSNVSPSKQTA